MSATFDVTTEPWIPVRRSTGETAVLSLTDVLGQAHDLDEIADTSAMVEYGLYRLLTVFLMDALRPADDRALQQLRAAGRFDMDAIGNYISTCRAEGTTFDIFDTERPFLQSPPQAAWDGVRKPVGFIDYTIPTGGNHVHFDHRDAAETALSYAQAAQRLPAVQLFCTAAVQGYPSTINGAPPYYVLVRGINLFETLVLSLVSAQAVQPAKLDQPPVWWRTDGQIEPKAPVVQTSWLHGALFPARRLRLIPDDGLVREMYFAQGLNFDKVAQAWTDPHVAYGYDEKRGRYNWKPNGSKALWRNIGMLTMRDQLPQILRQLKSRPGASDYVRLQVYGVETNQASYLDSRRYDLELPEAIVGDPEAAQMAMDAVSLAEEVAALLVRTLRWRGRSDLDRPIADAARQQFYDNCENRFWQYLRRLAAEPDLPADAWFEEVNEAARQTLDLAIESMQLRGVDLMHLQKNARKLYAALGRIRRELAEQVIE
ncbi:MAG: type I-E CRISPR-associated protein Cse1/CasA [Clostridia bacterium]|nr:type I-E CRISPR-associated protein Cse1/CasA [Clostridia bacterium]